MKLIRTIAEMQAWSAEAHARGKSVGFVPTMGYLHNGHLALVERSRNEADLTVASIFVNPTQFAPNEDFTRYPRDAEGDRRKLEEAGCAVLFMPETGEMYPDGYSTYVTVGGVTEGYEGAIRPTHFQGVATIVAKLFNAVQPDVALFGRKDAQQVAVIRRMIRDLNFGIRLVVVDTVREESGLAMSSRNVYLSEKERNTALSLSRALDAAVEAAAAGASVEEAAERMRSMVDPDVELDYAAIVDADTFQVPVDGEADLLAIIAGRVGKTRLIDNMKVGERNGSDS